MLNIFLKNEKAIRLLGNALKKKYPNKLASTFLWYAERLCQPVGQNQIVFVAGFAKSATTFLSRTLAELFSYRMGTAKASGLYPDLYYPRLLDISQDDCVVQQHVVASDKNIQLMNKFNIRPVVLTRNIFDVIISIHDHYGAVEVKKDKSLIPDLYSRYDKMSREERMDLFIKFFIPWYYNVYISWFKAQEHKNIDMLWLTYEELISRPEKTLGKIARFYNREDVVDKINGVLTSMDEKKANGFRFNKGVSGRGGELTDAQKKEIRSPMKFYPDVDFSKMGL